jgi:hypothetical protein
VACLEAVFGPQITQIKEYFYAGAVPVDPPCCVRAVMSMLFLKIWAQHFSS